MAPGGQVMVDYSAIGGYPGTGVTPGGSYGQTGYYGGVYGGGQPGQPVALVYFQNGSAALSTNDRSIINDVARLQKAQGGLIRVVGHASLATDNVDPASHDKINYEMSLARANAVAQALMRAGVPSNQLQVAAVGSSDPEYYEFTPTGEAGNRRAEIYLVY
jgi:flagellar motor protein MotB